MTMLRPKKSDELFEADRPAKELQATKRNWNPWILFGAFVIALVTLVILEPRLWFWVEEEEPQAKTIEPAFNVAALTEFEHPEPPLVERQVQVPVTVPGPRVEVPKILTITTPPPPREEITIDRVRLDGTIAYAPQGEQHASIMADGLRPLEAWGCAIRPALNVIQATLNDDIRWDYKGPINATVTEDVLSPEAFARGQRIVLIPQGAQLMGLADTVDLNRGMDLADGLRLTEVSFVDTAGMPRSINLFEAQGAGASGINAIGGEVDPRWGPIFAAATFFTVLDVIGGVSFNFGDSDTVNVRVSGNSAAEIGRDVVDSMLDWKPRILTRKGTQIVVKPTRPIRVC